MATDLIRYDLLVQDALKGVVKRVLEDTRREGLPGEHYFYITFRTKSPGVRLSDRMRERYPDEMTIVLQHQFWDLGVNENGFEVGLSFSGVPERLLIPFSAMTGFFDPSVPFSVKFEVQDKTADAKAGGAAPVALPSTQPAPASLPKAIEATTEPSPRKAVETDVPAPSDVPRNDDAKVVSIDAFRKKP